MSGFTPVDFPQTQGRVGEKGPDGAAGAPGATGPPGANGAPGAVSITTIDLSQSQLANMATTPIVITADNDGFIQLAVFALIEISLTTAGAANPVMRIRWRGTSLDAVQSTTVGLNGALQVSYFTRVPAALQTNQAGVGLRTPIEGLGLTVDWGSAPGGVFQATGRVSVAIATVPAVVS